MKDRKEPIIVEHLFHQHPRRVWQSLTERDQMVQWFFENIPEFDATEGFATNFNVSTPNRDYLHQWRITEVIPESKIVYHWSYKGLPGVGWVTFELFPRTGKRTLLRLTNTGLDSFPDDLPELTRESCLAGWNYFIKERLKSFLEDFDSNK